jgi:hypothetical protein
MGIGHQGIVNIALLARGYYIAAFIVFYERSKTHYYCSACISFTVLLPGADT